MLDCGDSRHDLGKYHIKPFGQSIQCLHIIVSLTSRAAVRPSFFSWLLDFNPLLEILLFMRIPSSHEKPFEGVLNNRVRHRQMFPQRPSNMRGLGSVQKSSSSKAACQIQARSVPFVREHRNLP